MAHFDNKQSGMTGMAIMFLLVLFAFAVLVLLTIAPVYMENFQVASSLNTLAEESDISKKSKKEIRTLLAKRFRVNNVQNVANENITFSSENRIRSVNVIYEVRKPLLLNIDIVLKFDDSVELR